MMILDLCEHPGEIKSGVLRIGSVQIPVYNPNESMKVPDVLFYENTQVSIDLLFFPLDLLFFQMDGDHLLAVF